MISNFPLLKSKDIIKDVREVETLLLIILNYINLSNLSLNDGFAIWIIQNKINHWGRNALITSRDWDKLVEIEKKLRVV